MTFCIVKYFIADNAYYSATPPICQVVPLLFGQMPRKYRHAYTTVQPNDLAGRRRSINVGLMLYQPPSGEYKTGIHRSQATAMP